MSDFLLFPLSDSFSASVDELQKIHDVPSPSPLPPDYIALHRQWLARVSATLASSECPLPEDVYRYLDEPRAA